MIAQFIVRWLDSGRAPLGPQHPFNPDFPQGRDLDVSRGADPACTFELPYPAPRCGVFAVRCTRCGLQLGFTAAGRPDDPRQIKVACRPSLH